MQMAGYSPAGPVASFQKNGRLGLLGTIMMGNDGNFHGNVSITVNVWSEHGKAYCSGTGN